MIISSEIEKVEKVENLGKRVGKGQKSTLRAFARTRANNVIQNLKLEKNMLKVFIKK